MEKWWNLRVLSPDSDPRDFFYANGARGTCTWLQVLVLYQWLVVNSELVLSQVILTLNLSHDLLWHSIPITLSSHSSQGSFQLIHWNYRYLYPQTGTAKRTKNKKHPSNDSIENSSSLKMIPHCLLGSWQQIHKYPKIQDTQIPFDITVVNPWLQPSH